jgi:CheY-like chemotaxis protein
MPDPLHLLIVDDQPDSEALFNQQFRRERKRGELHMRFARSGEEALAAAGEREPQCALILSDIHMAGMNGLELLQRLKRDHPAVRVVMLTMSNDTSEERARELGADACVTKPIDFTELRRKVFRT